MTSYLCRVALILSVSCCLQYSTNAAAGIRKLKKRELSTVTDGHSSDLHHGNFRKTRDVRAHRRVSFSFHKGKKTHFLVSGIDSGKLVSSGTLPGTVIIKRHVFVEGKDRRLDFPIDRTVSELTVELKGDCGEFTIFDSQKKMYNYTMESTYGAPESGLSRADSVGQWSILINGTSKCSVEVMALSSLGYVLTLLSRTPLESDTDCKLLKGNPAKNKPLCLVLDGFGFEMLKSGSKDHPTKVRFLDDVGNDVETPEIVTDNTDGVDSSVKVSLKTGLQADEVNVLIEGMDFDGNLFNRIIPSPITTSHVILKCQFHDLVIEPETETIVNVTIYNKGLNDTFTVFVSDSKGFVSTVDSTLQVNHKERKEVQIRLFAPWNTKTGVKSFVYLTVQGNRTGSHQYENCSVVVRSNKRPRINSLSIKGTVNSRFAETVVTSLMTNDADVGLEANFDVILPLNAFITNLTMRMDNLTIIGKVDEKEKAEKIYEKAKKRGKTAGKVSTRKKSTRIYKTSLFVEPGKNVTFRLTYQELLQRSRGKYKYAVVLNPHQPVKRLHITVNILENNPIDFVSLPFFDTGVNNEALIKHPTGTAVMFNGERKHVQVRYSPSITQQVALSPHGLSGSFSVLYDVVRSSIYGDVTFSNGYFTHFFYPPYVPVRPKKVVFIIDKSGSMGNEKIKQVKDAFSTILRTLNENDFFDMVFFDDSATHEFGNLVPASSSNVQEAVRFIKRINAGGGTSIVPAFKKAFVLMSNDLSPSLPDEEPDSSGFASGDDIDDFDVDVHLSPEEPNFDRMMVFLTDGMGENSKYVMQNLKEFNNVTKIPIHTIAFGRDADEDLLQRIANGHKGAYRKILQGVKSSLQIQDFFDEVANSVLTDVTVTYPTNRIGEVTRNSFNILPVGKELVWAGKIKEKNEEEELLDVGNELDTFLPVSDADSGNGNPYVITAHISGKHTTEDIDMDVPIDTTPSDQAVTSHNRIPNFAERMWAFLHIKELFRQIALSNDVNRTELLKEEALNISLKYNFVTPLTSMVVLLPNERKKIEDELKQEEAERKAREKEENDRRKAEEQARLEEEKRQREAEVERQRIEETKRRSHLKQAAPKPMADVQRGYYYGDPHFVIPLLPDFNLCFNWNGKEGQVYNLFYEPSSGISVNGQLVDVPAPPDSKHENRTYMSALGFLIPEHALELIIRPETITFFPTVMENFTIPVTSGMTFRRRGLYLHVYDVTHKTARIFLSVSGWNFNVFLTRVKHLPHKTSHVDLQTQRHSSRSTEPTMGVIGQFLHADVSWIDQQSPNERILKINGRSGRVIKYQREDFDSDQKITCWQAHKEARDLIRGTHKQYLVAGLLETPNF